jgi:multiple sugar transport system permease protein
VSEGTRRRISLLLGDAVVVAGLVVFLVWTLAPIVWMGLTSFLPHRALITRPPDVSFSLLTLGNIRGVLEDGSGLMRAFGNSALIAVATTALALTLGSLAAYAIARLSMPAGNQLMLMVLATQMFPGIVLIIPLFIVLSRAGMIDTHLALILVYLSFVLPVVMWILKGFFESIPIELERAAAVDGASTLQTFRLVVLPMSLPPLFAAGVFAFIESWNEFFYAVILTRTEVKTVPIKISEFSGQYQTAFGQMIAASMLASIPVVLVAIIFRRYILLGFSEGAVKG